MAHLFLHAIVHSLEDVLKSAPILLVVYAVLYWLEHRMRAAPALLEKAQKVGPIIGAAAGSVPQCGFSAAASALFVEGFLHPATLVAVFLATSDEAVPLLLSGGMTKETVLLLIVKFMIAVAGGYLLQWTVFRKKKHSTTPVNIDISHHHSDCCGASVVSAIVWRTVHTCLFLLGIMVVINLAVEIVGEDTIASLLLSGSRAPTCIVRCDRADSELCHLCPAQRIIYVRRNRLRWSDRRSFNWRWLWIYDFTARALQQTPCNPRYCSNLGSRRNGRNPVPDDLELNANMSVLRGGLFASKSVLLCRTMQQFKRCMCPL